MSKKHLATLESKSAVGGQFRAVVRNRDGSIAKDYGWQRNLILPAGFQNNVHFSQQFTRCHAGTGTTPNFVLLDGTFEQTGTTLTRVTGSGVFTSGNVNDFVKFATGEIGKITVFTNSLTVTIDRSQTVAAAALTVYDCSRVALDTWFRVNTTSTAVVGVQDTDARTSKFTKTFDFAFETVAKTYTELGVSTLATSGGQLFSRILLDSPVLVNVDQFLQVDYSLTCIVSNYGTSAAISANITGWPYPYAITSIIANGTYFDVVLAEPHHYAATRPVIITGALPVKTAISTITSTGSDFTVNATGHGKTIGQSIVLDGVSVGAYNGTWTVATVPNANSLTVTTGINPGAASGGTVRLATPGTWFDGTWTAASFPTSSTIRVTSAITPPPAGASGNVTNSTAAVAQIVGYGFDGTGDSSVSTGALDWAVGAWRLITYNEASMKTGLVYGSQLVTSSSTFIQATSVGNSDLTNRTKTYTWTIPSASGNDNIKQMLFAAGWTASASGLCLGGTMLTFTERQNKKVGYQLVVTFKISWDPVLN